MDPLAVILVAAFSSLLSLGVGGLAIRAILGGKLITIASHREHVQQWEGQVAGLRLRLSEQEEAHNHEMDRMTTASEQRVIEAKTAADIRVEDRDKQIIGMSREMDRLHSAIALGDESYREVTRSQIHGQESAIRTVTSILRASPLFDPDRHPELPTVVDEHGQQPDGTGGPDGR